MEIINANFRMVEEYDLENLMRWRMLPEITKFMNTDPQITMVDQYAWFERIKMDQELTLPEGRKNFYWILEVDNVPVGLASLVGIEYTHKKVSTGLYIAEKSKRSLRLAVDTHVNLYDYAFDCLNMNKVCEEVFAENVAVNRILDLCGSKREGVHRCHVFKNGVYHDVVSRGILREEWEEKRKNLKYNKFDFK